MGPRGLGSPEEILEKAHKETPKGIPHNLLKEIHKDFPKEIAMTCVSWMAPGLSKIPRRGLALDLGGVQTADLRGRRPPGSAGRWRVPEDPV